MEGTFDSATITLTFSTDSLASESPSAFFDSVGEVLESLQFLDANLLNFVAPEGQVRLSIADISISSLRLKLATVLEHIPEEVLGSGDWKKVLGFYLVKARKSILAYLRKAPKTATVESIEALGEELDSAAYDAIQQRRRFPRTLLVYMLSRVIRAVQSVPVPETVTVETDGEKYQLPRNTIITSEVANTIATADLEPFEQEMTLLVKKPDMIRRSQWEFVDRGHVIREKMLNEDWVTQYQNRLIDLNPGDAVDAKVRVTPRPVTGKTEAAYEVLTIHRVVSNPIAQQSLLFEAINSSFQ